MQLRIVVVEEVDVEVVVELVEVRCSYEVEGDVVLERDVLVLVLVEVVVLVELAFSVQV